MIVSVKVLVLEAMWVLSCPFLSSNPCGAIDSVLSSGTGAAPQRRRAVWRWRVGRRCASPHERGRADGAHPEAPAGLASPARLQRWGPGELTLPQLVPQQGPDLHQPLLHPAGKHASVKLLYHLQTNQRPHRQGNPLNWTTTPA